MVFWLAAMALLLMGMLTAPGVTLGLLAGFVYSSRFEHWVHAGPMHHKSGGIAYERHVRDHHANRRAPVRYLAEKREQYRIGESAVPLIWLGHMIAIAGLWLITRQTSFWVSFTLIATVYFVLYEFLHHEMHQPHERWYHRTDLFQFLSELHRLHHYKAKENFNLVCPLWDWILGTLSTEELKPEASAPVGTPQPTGPRSVFSWFPEFAPKKS
ncbi:MAG TPA: sterol desaturase family protein [Patescibacteria group bacterium]